MKYATERSELAVGRYTAYGLLPSLALIFLVVPILVLCTFLVCSFGLDYEKKRRTAVNVIKLRVDFDNRLFFMS